MTTDAPPSAQLLIPANHDLATIPWPEARSRLAEAFTYWLATVHPDGRPQQRPVLAVWVNDALHTTTNPNARKGRNLASDVWRRTVTASTSSSKGPSPG